MSARKRSQIEILNENIKNVTIKEICPYVSQAVSFQPLDRIQFSKAHFFRFVLRISRVKKILSLFAFLGFFGLFSLFSLFFFLIFYFFSFLNIQRCQKFKLYYVFES